MCLPCLLVLKVAASFYGKIDIITLSLIVTHLIIINHLSTFYSTLKVKVTLYSTLKVVMKPFDIKQKKLLSRKQDLALIKLI